MAIEMISMIDKDKFYMSRAAVLARKGEYGAHPNPMVGAVVVKGGRIIGEGWHRSFGGPHAEINALKTCSASAAGATLYVTLEPCSTYGKTPPCTAALIKAKLGRIVIGAADPNPANRGRAAKILSAAGIKTKSHVLENVCLALNPAFNKFMRTGLPFVTLKTAQSLDGKIADFRGRARWISGPAARLETHKLRARSDAVLAGINTVLKDDPMLNVRGVKVSRQPYIIILDSTLKISRSAALFSNDRVIIATTKKAPARAIKKLNRQNARIMVLPADSGGRVSLKALLTELGKLGIAHLLVEGGGTVIGSFISEGLADRLVCFIAPLVIGGAASKSPVIWNDSLNAKRKELGIRVKMAGLSLVGEDLMVEYSLNPKTYPVKPARLYWRNREVAK
ncbi:MAG: bifunctional diaminohydroxyphosphoribosylaminopyrimidine deaminase/5-amino-6-(5-phosphoribosylamino)uracil reductase RibD [Elusimicrobia bacterium]|nr:bifunctional diaminohydroxyphosphoribosylaminopyrimidine deaminase/5-amino-6-(5-phosphoribosylamino)uracil reductase RibD [Elusimicrobiota bacterium]